MKYPFSRRVSALALSIASLGIAAFSAAPAQASLLSPSTCDASHASQPFSPWGDKNTYVLAPGGAFSGHSTNWTLHGNASLQNGGEPYNVSDTASPASVVLAPGAYVQSPFACVNLQDPTFRFFAKSSGLLGTALVSAVYQLPGGLQLPVPVGVVALSGSWHPSLTMLTGSGVPSALTTGQGQVALRFTALLGTTRIDDVYIDPHMRT
jgi:hypothetical protein